MFHNYETLKLFVPDPDLAQAAILGILAVLTIASLARAKRTELLDRSQTDQMKGLAALMVIQGHLWVHVSSTKPDIIMSGDGLAIFLALSGFGLTISSGGRCPDWRSFASHRLIRVMVPYWVTTFLFLVLDGVLLGRWIGVCDLLGTLIGVNITPATRGIDYVRWFVTFMLLWYLVFYIAMLLRDKARVPPVAFLFGAAVALLLLSYYVFHFGSKFLAFPAGCALASLRDRARPVLASRRWLAPVGGLGLLAAFAMLKWLVPVLLPQQRPYLLVVLAEEASSLVLAGGVVLLLAAMGSASRTSGFLQLCGAVSYELILLHGAFLVKYNPVFTLVGVRFLPVGFVILLGALLLLSLGLRRGTAALGAR